LKDNQLEFTFPPNEEEINEMFFDREQMARAYDKYEGYRSAMRGLFKAHENHIDLALVKHISECMAQGFEKPMSNVLEGYAEGLNEISESIKMLEHGIDPVSMEKFTCSRQMATTFWISFLKDAVRGEEPF